VAGDKFKLGSRLETGALLFGRQTWQLFSTIWPNRSDDFSMKMNNAPKWVASRTLTDVSAWANSSLISGELTSEVARLRGDRDVIVIGSTSVVHQLMQHDLVDEYRLLSFPTVLGTGRRLFETPTGAEDLRLASVEQSGAAALLRYEKTSRA
jgi:dihydrofolate reductase